MRILHRDGFRAKKSIFKFEFLKYDIYLWKIFKAIYLQGCWISKKIRSCISQFCLEIQSESVSRKLWPIQQTRKKFFEFQNHKNTYNIRIALSGMDSNYDQITRKSRQKVHWCATYQKKFSWHFMQLWAFGLSLFDQIQSYAAASRNFIFV